MKKVIFLDRDGVVNVDKGYVYKIEDFEFKDGIFEFLEEIEKMGYGCIIITNQSGIGRGYYTLDQYYMLDGWMIEEFKKRGIMILKSYFCPHTPSDMCNCRKPKAGMIQRATREHHIDLPHSMLLGDKLSDINAGINGDVGINILLKGKIGEDYTNSKADFIGEDFNQILEYIKQRSRG